jgi:hypothetical protein
MAATGRFSWALLLALAASGGDDDGPDARPPVGGTVELGTGTSAFVSIAPESELGLVSGPLGGHLFIVHARLTVLVPGDPSSPGEIGNPSTRFTVENEAGERLDIDMAPYRLGYEELDGDGVYTLPGGRICQVLEEAVDEIDGGHVRLRVEVTDARDRIATVDVWVNAFLIPPE